MTMNMSASLIPRRPQMLGQLARSALRPNFPAAVEGIIVQLRHRCGLAFSQIRDVAEADRIHLDARIENRIDRVVDGFLQTAADDREAVATHEDDGALAQGTSKRGPELIVLHEEIAAFAGEVADLENRRAAPQKAGGVAN